MEDGSILTIFGGDMRIDGQEDIRYYLDKDGRAILRGTDTDGNKILLLGSVAEYKVEDGRKSVALMAGTSMDFLKEALFLDEEDAMLYSHIIDEDGSFIVRAGMLSDRIILNVSWQNIWNITGSARKNM